MRDGADTDLMHGFNFHSELTKLEDGRHKATTTIGGKRYEAFDRDEMWATRKLQGVVETAVKTGDVVLNSI